MFLNIISYEIKCAYKVIIKNPTIENPIAAAVVSTAIKTFSLLAIIFASSLQITPYLGVTSFIFSIIIDIALISNIKEIKENIEYEKLSASERGEKDASEFKEDIEDAADRVEGFFKSLFSRGKK